MIPVSTNVYAVRNGVTVLEGKKGMGGARKLQKRGRNAHLASERSHSIDTTRPSLYPPFNGVAIQCTQQKASIPTAAA